MPKEPIEKPAVEKKEVVFLRQLLETRGWKLIEKILKNNIEHFTELALTPSDINPSLAEETKTSKRELTLKWLKYNEILLNLPRSLIKSIESGEPIEQPTNFDPYFNEKDFEKK